jgi:hypothetical protein
MCDLRLVAFRWNGRERPPDAEAAPSPVEIGLGAACRRRLGVLVDGRH